MTSYENPLLYRFRQSAAHQPVWKKLLGWGIYPALVVSPALLSFLSRGHNDVYCHACPDYKLLYIVALFLHFAYFCGRPLMASVSTLASEKQKGTFECLATTGFTAKQWIATLFGVCMGPRMLELALFGWLLGILPAAGGLGVTLPILFYTLTCVVFYGAAGLWISGRSRNVASAQLYAILFLCTTFFFVLAGDILLTDVLFRTNKPLICQYVSPFIVAGLFWEGHRDAGAFGWLFASLAQLLFAGLLLRSARAQLSLAAPAVARPRRRSGLLKFFAEGVSDPIFYRSLLQLSGQRGLLFRLLAYPALLLSIRFVLPFFSHSYSSHRSLEAAFLLSVLGHFVYLTVRAAVAGSRAVAEERESRTWESLLSTRLSLAGIVWGQFASRILPIMLECLLWSFLWLSYSRPMGGHFDLRTLVFVIVYSVIWTAFVGTLALWQSSRSATAAQALRNVVSLLFVLGLGTIFLDAALFQKIEHFAILSPVYALVCVCENSRITEGGASLLFYSLAAPICLALCGQSLVRQELRFTR